jgi:putative protease
MEPVEEGLKGQRISVPVDIKLRRSDKLFKVVDAKDVKERREFLPGIFDFQLPQRKK